jgi:hypothetical protein
MRRMLFLNMMRREAARATVEAIGQSIAVDLVGARARRSRRQHLRNGIGAILQATSRVAWRPTPLVSFLYLTRGNVQSELRYGLDELRRGLRPSSVQARRALVLAAASSFAVALALVVRARSKRGEGNGNGGGDGDGQGEPPAPSAAEQALAGVRE